MDNLPQAHIESSHLLERMSFMERLRHSRLAQFGAAVLSTCILTAVIPERGSHSAAEAQIAVGTETLAGQDEAYRRGDLSEPATPLLPAVGELTNAPDQKKRLLPPRETGPADMPAATGTSVPKAIDGNTETKQRKSKMAKEKTRNDEAEPVPVLGLAPMGSGNVLGPTLPPRVVTASPPSEAVQPTEVSPEKQSSLLADKLLRHPKISISTDNARIRHSIEYLRDHGRTFTKDVENIGKEEVAVDPQILQLVIDLADGGIEVTVSSLTTGYDHSPTSWHYAGQAIDLQFKNPTDLQKAFGKIHNERVERGINELIHGGELPKGTTNLKGGDAHNYPPAVKDSHTGHIHIARSPQQPSVEPAPTTTIENQATSTTVASSAKRSPFQQIGGAISTNMQGVLRPQKLPPRTPREITPPASPAPAEAPAPEIQPAVSIPPLEALPAFKSVSGEALAKLKEIHKDTPELRIFMAAIQSQESSGKSDAVGPPVKGTGELAFGYYQIMPSNWPAWCKEAFGEVRPQTPDNQQVVASNKMKQYYEAFGSWDMVAVAWFGGPGKVQQLKRGDTSVWYMSDGYMTIRQYVDKMQRGMDRIKQGQW